MRVELRAPESNLIQPGQICVFNWSPFAKLVGVLPNVDLICESTHTDIVSVSSGFCMAMSEFLGTEVVSGLRLVTLGSVMPVSSFVPSKVDKTVYSFVRDMMLRMSSSPDIDLVRFRFPVHRLNASRAFVNGSKRTMDVLVNGSC